MTANVQWETLLGAPISDVEPDLREVDEEVELDPALLAERMLRQLRASNPEWEARRKEVLLRQRVSLLAASVEERAADTSHRPRRSQASRSERSIE